jgi:putative CocE/NonD family hydrolase
LILVCGVEVFATDPKPSIALWHVPIPMRDGVHLSANVVLPSENAPLPAILVRTPYGKGTSLIPNYQAFVDRGYAVIVEDVRGRYDSEGAFEPLTQESSDGSDTIDWIARQRWSNGKVGMIGGSYLGIAQWKAALTGNPHLKAIFPVVSGDDDYLDRFYSPGGALKLGHRLEWLAENRKAPGYEPDFNKFIWHLPLWTADVAATGKPDSEWSEAMEHPGYDAYWQVISTREHLDKIRVPVFAVGGWYDNYVESDLDAYAALRRSSGLNHILIGPWPHNMSSKFAEVDFGPDSGVPVRRLQLQWFDQWLGGKDSPLVSAPPVRIFVMGANRWREDREWPPAGTRRKILYLESRGHANTLAGDGALQNGLPQGEGTDSYTYDPRNPVPTRGGAVCCNPRVFPWGPLDQRSVEKRPDVLVYTTARLETGLEVVGPVKVVLYVASTAKDTDFTAKLVDVFPDGSARILSDGILRLRYRQSLAKPILANPGAIYDVTIDAGVTANFFPVGHRLRLEISSSNFPRFDRNPNTGGAIAAETQLLRANQRIYHGSAHPSRLELRVMPPARTLAGNVHRD